MLWEDGLPKCCQGGSCPVTSERGTLLAGGGFAWGDFPLLRACEPAPAAPDGPPKPVVPGPLSRFTVSPTAPSSRFSITHVSDSDAGPMGGEAVGL